uniref:START domain-containing protein n=1 Tax=Cyanistes caeruleus TaxID=156563 RepID=A0A8C0U6M5_CYACU
MAAIGAAFVWDGRRIEEEEMRRTAQELQQLENPEEFPEREQPWELIMEREHFRLWRRPIPGSTLFQYRVFGSYTDVTPRQFFNVQLDTEYRKKWDSLVLKLDVVERDPASGSEVIHWVTQFPVRRERESGIGIRESGIGNGIWEWDLGIREWDLGIWEWDLGIWDRESGNGIWEWDLGSGMGSGIGNLGSGNGIWDREWDPGIQEWDLGMGSGNVGMGEWGNLGMGSGSWILGSGFGIWALRL